MKTLALILGLALTIGTAHAQWGYNNNYSNPYANSNTVNVQGYTRSNGTYVQGYTRTAPDTNTYNNYSAPRPYVPYNSTPSYSRPSGYGTEMRIR